MQPDHLHAALPCGAGPVRAEEEGTELPRLLVPVAARLRRGGVHK